VGGFELLDLGMANAASRFISVAVARKDHAEQAALVVSFRRYYRRAGLCVMGLTILVAGTLYSWAVDASSHGAWKLFLVLGLAQGLTMGMRVYPALLKGHLRYQVLILAGSARVIIFSIGLFVLHPARLTLETLVLLHVTLLFCEQFCLYFKARPLVPLTAHSLGTAKKNEIAQFAGKNIAALTAQFFRERIDTQLLASFVSLGAVTQYAVGVRLPNLVTDLANAVFGGHLMAGFANAATRKDDVGVLDDLLTVLRLSACASLSFCTMLFFLGPAFLTRWLGNGFEDAGIVLRVILPGIMLTAMQFPVFSILPALNKHGRLATAYLATAVLNFGLSWFLVQRIGLTGVVWATTVDLSLQALLVLPWLISRAFPITRLQYLVKAVLLPILAYGLGLIPLGWFWLTKFNPVSYAELALAATVLAVAAIPIGWLVVLQGSDRRLVWGQARRLLQRNNRTS